MAAVSASAGSRQTRRSPAVVRECVGWGAFATLVVPGVLILTGAQVSTAVAGAGAVAAVTTAIFVLVRMTRLSLPALGGDATSHPPGADENLRPAEDLTGERPDGHGWSPEPPLHRPWPYDTRWPDQPLEDPWALPSYAGLPPAEPYDGPWRPPDRPEEPGWPPPPEVTQLHERIEYGFGSTEPYEHRLDQPIPPEYPPVGYAPGPPAAPRHSGRPPVPRAPEAPVGPSLPPPHHFDDRTAGSAEPPRWHDSAGPPPPGLGPYGNQRHERPVWDMDSQPDGFPQPRAAWLPQPASDDPGPPRSPAQRRRHRRAP